MTSKASSSSGFSSCHVGRRVIPSSTVQFTHSRLCLMMMMSIDIKDHATCKHHCCLGDLVLTLIFAGNVLGRTLHVIHMLSLKDGTMKGT